MAFAQPTSHMLDAVQRNWPRIAGESSQRHTHTLTFRPRSDRAPRARPGSRQIRRRILPSGARWHSPSTAVVSDVGARMSGSVSSTTRMATLCRCATRRPGATRQSRLFGTSRSATPSRSSPGSYAYTHALSSPYTLASTHTRPPVSYTHLRAHETLMNL
eukprot:2393000-Prymnesium_polylepis.2